MKIVLFKKFKWFGLKTFQPAGLLCFISSGLRFVNFQLQKQENSNRMSIFCSLCLLVFLITADSAFGEEVLSASPDNQGSISKDNSRDAVGPAFEKTNVRGSERDQKASVQGNKKSSKKLSNKNEAKEIKTLDELLKQIQKDQVAQRPELKKREVEFLKARDQQKTLLNQALSELKKEEQILSSLQQVFEKQDKALSQLEEKLALTMGALGELFGVVKQTAGETKALFENSVVSAQYKNRTDFVKKISAKKNLPNIPDLEMLWFLIQQEMTESGKVTRFTEEVVKANGKTKSQSVVRVGSFNLVSQGKYLVYDKETHRVAELARQPSRRFLSLVKKLEKSKKDISAFGVDPSRGSLLSLLIQTPNLFERVSQGGIIGYIILFLLICGLFLSVQKYLKLRKQEKLLDLQIQSDEVLKNNPLGELIQIFVKFKGESQETLELKMEEAIVKKTSHLKKGISTIKLVSSIAPLLGLLGTVTGMIATFQSITLFGTGDPKLMAGGISQALVTTALGLVVAIPLVFIHNFLSGKANDLISLFEEQTLGLLSRKYKEKKTSEE